VKLNIRPKLELRLRMNGSIPPLPPRVTILRIGIALTLPYVNSDTSIFVEKCSASIEITDVRCGIVMSPAYSNSDSHISCSAQNTDHANDARHWWWMFDHVGMNLCGHLSDRITGTQYSGSSYGLEDSGFECGYRQENYLFSIRSNVGMGLFPGRTAAERSGLSEPQSST